MTEICCICNQKSVSYLAYPNKIVVCYDCQYVKPRDIRTYLIIKKLEKELPVEYIGGYREYEWTDE
jgi:hypothetical protein